MSKFPHYPQLNAMDCGPTCLRIIAKHYGKIVSINKLRELAEIGKDGASLLGLAKCAEAIGFRSFGARVTFEQISKDVPLPCIAHWKDSHFLVLYKIKGEKVYVSDPSAGLISFTRAEFESQWCRGGPGEVSTGFILIIEPTPKLFEESEEIGNPVGFQNVLRELYKYKRLLVQLFIGVLISIFLQGISPFLAQSVVDTGVNTKNIRFVYLILTAQFFLLISRMTADFIRSWITLHVGARLNLSIISDFLSKLLRLPVAFYDTRLTGDLLQRVNDHSRIENFLTGTSLTTLFSLFSLSFYGVILAIYDTRIFVAFFILSTVYIIWIILFLKARSKIDQKRFSLSSRSQSGLIEIIMGLPEIKLSNAEHAKRWNWESIQVSQFKLSMKGLALSQYQQTGGAFINEGKNFLITSLAVVSVINGSLSIGSLIAIQFIVGQMNSPVEQLIIFFQHWQDAKMSIERLSEIHELDDEDHKQSLSPDFLPKSLRDPTFRESPEHVSENGIGLVLEDVWFAYPGAGNQPVLRGINLVIPPGKVTAIVGNSGSGKTTLLKLLLKFYNPQRGVIATSHGRLSEISSQRWRSVCGTVLQDGYIFSDTLANNVTIGDDTPNVSRLKASLKIANCDFISSLPLSYNTKIGPEGTGLSGGQRQRILIARAIYKDPEILLFDEATSALDSNNERQIVENLESFFRHDSRRNRTVIIVAHRLSTVKSADQIVVLEQGEIVEQGSHRELTKMKGKYFNLVKNQLELGE